MMNKKMIATCVSILVALYAILVIAIFFVIAFTQPAHAYDADEAAGKYVKCLIKNQRTGHYQSGLSLAMNCRREMGEYDIYNCPSEPQSCTGSAIEMAGIIIQKIP